MKIYTGYPGGITKITNDKGFYQTEDLANVISVYVNQADVTGITYTLALEFLRADGRKTTIYTEDGFASGEATTLTEENVTYDIHNFTLTNTQLAVAGALAFTCYINILNSGVVEKRGVLFNAVSNVRKTVTYSANTIFAVSEDDEDVPTIVADMKRAIESLSNQLAGKVNTADIADNLTTNNSSKVLSAKQGYILKAMLDTLTSTTYTKAQTDNLLNLKADKSNTYTIAQVNNMVDGLYVSKMYGNIRMSVSDYNGELVLDSNVKNRYVDPTWYHLQVGDKIVFNGNTNYRYWLAIKDNLSDSTIHDSGWKQETYVANAEVYVRITLAKTDNSNISIDFAELLGEDVITIHTRKPVTVRIGTVYGTNLNSYLYYSGSDTFDHRLRTSVIKFNKGDIINFKEFGTKYEWSFMAWDLDGTFISETLWKDGNVYVVQQDCQAVIIFKKSGYDKSLMLKGNIYFKKDLDGTDSATKSVIVLDNTCVKTGETITISNTSNALLYKIDFLSDEWGQGTTSLQTINYGTSSATVTANMSNVKNVAITMKKTDGTSFSSIASEILWNIYRQDNITSSLGDKYDVDAIYNVDFEVNGTFETNTFNSNVVQCGHRGWDTLAPENTIPSFELAYKLGCRFIEGDVRWTADGVPVLMHDATINRTARNSDGTTLGSTINIADITYAEALEYDYGIYQGALYKGTKLPTFDEVMKWCKTRDVYFQIDTTTGDWNETQMMSLFKIVKKYGMLDHVLWESLYASKLRKLYTLGVNPKNSMISFYGNITTANVDTAYNLGCKVFSIQYTLATYSLIQYVISKGMKPYIWFDDLDKNAYNVFRLFNLGTIGFYNTKITDIYALRWFKTLIGYDDNSQSAVTNKEEELLQQAYSDISNLLSDVSTLEQELNNAINALRWELGSHTLDVTTDSDTKYIKSVPSGAIGCQINSVGGMSYKSENLIVLNDVAETTANGITYSVTDGVLSVRGTASAETTIEINLSLNVNVGTYYLKVFNWTTGLGIDYYCINRNYTYDFYNTSNGSSIALTKTYSASELLRTMQLKIANGTAISGTLQLNPMLVSGSTAPTTFKPYFDGIRDSAVTSVVSKDSSNNTIDTLTINSAIQNLTGYGWGINDTCYNYIDFERKVFVQKVGRVDLGSLDWSYNSSVGRFGATDFSTYKKPTNNNTALVGLCDKYSITSWNDLVNNNTDMNIAVLSSNNNIIVRNTNYTSNEAFKTAMSGVYLYYELETPIETDISAYLTTDIIDVEPLGTLEFTNTYNNDVPSDIDYLIEEVKA